MIINCMGSNLLIFIAFSKFMVGHRPILVLEAIKVKALILMIMIFIYDTF
jgi:hypothetical protein